MRQNLKIPPVLPPPASLAREPRPSGREDARREEAFALPVETPAARARATRRAARPGAEAAAPRMSDPAPRNAPRPPDRASRGPDRREPEPARPDESDRPAEPPKAETAGKAGTTPADERAARDESCAEAEAARAREDDAAATKPEEEAEDRAAPATGPLSEGAPALPVEEASRAAGGDALPAEAPASPAPAGSPLPTGPDPSNAVATAPEGTGTEHAASVIGARGREIPLGLHAAAAKQAEGRGREQPSTGPADSHAEGAEAVQGEPEQTTPQDGGAKLEAAARPDGPKPDLVREQPAPDPKGAAPSPAPPPVAPAERGANPAAPVPGPPVPVVHQVPLGAVPIEIGLKTLAGVNRFEIRLDPAELGRIDVTLEIGESGEVKAHLVVDRVETLGLLQRDAKTLERAFEQAGLKPSEGGVDLSLRDPSGDGRQQDRGREPDRDPRGQKRPDGCRANPDTLTDVPTRRLWTRASGVDLRI